MSLVTYKNDAIIELKQLSVLDQDFTSSSSLSH